MKPLFAIFTALLLLHAACFAGGPRDALALVERIIPGRSSSFRAEYFRTSGGKDRYEIESRGGRIVLRGNNNISVAVALYRYLRDYCHVSLSWAGDQLRLPRVFPHVKEKISAVSTCDYRYYFNYCTFSYSMAFWDWPRWQREVDWMALHGINLPLALTGQEAVWRNTLRRFGYSDSAIGSFISGPAFEAWWLMGNLEGWGGPVPASWIDGQAALQKKIVRRMRSLDMHPVLQGFYGMAPSTLAGKFPRARIHDPGTWLGFTRPAMLEPTDSLFAAMAKVYYAEQAKLYGPASFFAGDPFHEGGSTEGVDLAKAGAAIWKAMDESHPGAVWVLQSWQENPRQALLEHIPVGKALIINIMAEAKPQWGGRVKYMPARKGGFGPHHWIWSEIPNFGGRTGMTAKLDSTGIDIIGALHDPIGQKTMKGIGAAPEAIGQDAVLYDFLYDMAWTSSPPDMRHWLNGYAQSRYGRRNAYMEQAWGILRNTVYASTYGRKDPPLESIFCARPAWGKQSASTWGEGGPDYPPSELVKAWRLGMKALPALGQKDTYRYDIVNITRQVLANLGWQLYRQMEKAYRLSDSAAFRECSGRFLALIRDQDRLLSTRREFMTGPWLQAARQKGKTAGEKKLYEWNARTLITTWTHEPNDVNDYSCREWSGLLRDYYLPRWQMFVDACMHALQGKPFITPAYFSFELSWARRQNTYPVRPVENALTVVKTLYEKYGQEENLIPWSDARIGSEGRIYAPTPDAAQLSWAGSSICLRFNGTGMQCKIRDERGTNYYSVLVDGVIAFTLHPDTIARLYTLVEHLAPGIHHIRLFKRTQWDKGKTFFYGVRPVPGCRLLAAAVPKKRKMIFYGDSITSGSAVEDSAGKSGDAQYENNYLSYAAITARHYNAAYHCIARSGIGMMISWYPLTMPEMYNRLNPETATPVWNPSLFVPQVIVVNLFQNDAWLVSRSTDTAAIITAYEKFIRLLRRDYPRAKIICVLGNMDAVAPGSPWPGYIGSAVARLRDAAVYTHFFAYKQTPGHPGPASQQSMAVELERFIDEHINW